jgi:hypothetical protein
VGVCWTLSRLRTIMCGNPDAERFDTKGPEGSEGAAWGIGGRVIEGAMTLQTTSFIFGALLLAVAILGGGLKSKS